MPRPCSAAYAIEPAPLLLPAPGTRTAGLQDHGENHGNQYPNHEGNPKSPDCTKANRDGNVEAEARAGARALSGSPAHL